MAFDSQWFSRRRFYVFGPTLSMHDSEATPALPPDSVTLDQLLPAERWNHLAELHHTVARSRTIVISPSDAYSAAYYEYVLLEPIAPIVVAVTYEDRDACVIAHDPLWDSHSEPLNSLLEGTRARMQSGLLFEALEFAITAAGAMRDLGCENE